MNPYQISFPVTILSSLCLGVFVLLKNPRSLVHRTWGLACLCCFVWSLSFYLLIFSTTQRTADIGANLSNLTASWLCVLVVHFCLELTGQSGKGRAVVRLGYTLSLLITLLSAAGQFASARPTLSFNYYTAPERFYHLFTAQFFIYIFYAEYILIKALRSIPDFEKRNQIKYVLVGLTCGYLGGATTFLPVYGIPIEPFLSHFVWLYAAIISYGIAKHKLLDINVVIKKTVLYTILASVISVVYVLAVSSADKLMSGHIGLKIGDSQSMLTFLYALPPFMGTLLFFVMGFFILFHRPRKLSKTLFAILCFETFYWQFVWLYSFFCPQNELAHVAKVAYLTITYLPFTYYHFIAEELNERGERKWVSAFYLLASLLVIVTFPTDWFIAGNRHWQWGNFTRPGFLYPIFVLATMLSMGRGLLVIRRVYKKAADPAKRNQLKYFYLSMALYFLCTLDFMQIYGAPWYPIGSLFFIASFLVLAYAVMRHQLMDIKIAIKKTLFYSTITIAVSALYLTVVIVFYFIMVRFDRNPSFVVSLFSIVFIAVSLKPIELVLNRWLERRFFKGSISEIAEQKERLESELERVERLKSVGILAAGMAHEIKNPISTIRTFVEYLPKKYDDPDFREKFCRILSQETERISAIVKDLLMFSRPAEPKAQVFDPRALLKGILDMLSADLLRAGVHVEWEGSGSGAACFADPEQVRQVCLNILLNALDAMRGAPGKITLRIAADSSGVVISISDTGCGMTEDKLKHIFDPFYTDKDTGTGLGLAIAHAIMQKNNGRISVESLVGKGTTFWLYLPAVQR